MLNKLLKFDPKKFHRRQFAKSDVVCHEICNRNVNQNTSCREYTKKWWELPKINKSPKTIILRLWNLAISVSKFRKISPVENSVTTLLRAGSTWCWILDSRKEDVAWKSVKLWKPQQESWKYVTFHVFSSVRESWCLSLQYLVRIPEQKGGICNSFYSYFFANMVIILKR